MRWLLYLSLLAGCSGRTAIEAGTEPSPGGSSGADLVVSPTLTETKAAETKAAETKPSETKASETKAAETNAAENETAAASTGATVAAPASVPECSVVVEIISPDTHEGQSDASDSDTARDAARKAACKKFEAAEGLDCDKAKDMGTRHSMSLANGKRTSSTSITLARVWRGEGKAASAEGEVAACLAAQTAACQQALGTDCPAKGAVLVSLNGVPSRRRLLRREDLR